MRKNLFRHAIIATAFAFTLCPMVGTAIENPDKTSAYIDSRGYNSIKLGWGEVENINGYKIYRSTNKVTGYKHIKTTTKTTYTDSKLTPNKKYYYKIRAYKTRSGKTYNAKYSKIVYATTFFKVPAVKTYPYADSVRVKVTTAVSGAKDYRIYRKTATSTYKYLGVAYNGTFYDATAKKGKTYYYKTRGVLKVSGKNYYTPYSSHSKNKLSDRTLGIDVSKYQKDIDWNKVKETGVKYAMIRVGGRGWGEDGELYTDKYFDANMKGASAVGIDLGVYFYSAAKTNKEAREEAKYTIKKVEKYKDAISYPIAFDFEEWGKHRTKKLTKAKATSNAIAFCDTIEEAGYDSCVYASKSPYISKYETEKLAGYKFWLAHYTAEGEDSDYSGKYFMWQYASDGVVPGIKGNVDMNVQIPAKMQEEVEEVEE